MDIAQLPQSNVAALPPPGSAPSPISASLDSSCPLASLVFPQLLSHTQTSPTRPSATPPPGTLHLNVPLGTYLSPALASRWKACHEQLQRCQQEFAEDAVHELRVATRRLIAQLILLNCVVPSPSTEKARRLLKRLLVSLGELRDAQMQRLFIGRLIVRFPALVLLDEWLGRQERRLVRTAVKRVGRFKTRKLEKWMPALVNDASAFADAQDGLAFALWQAASEAFAEAVERRKAIDVADPRTIHQTRVAFKRFRYMVESLSPEVTGLSKQQLRTLAYYQRKMGIIQDLEVMQSCLAAFVREHEAAEDLLLPFRRYLQQRRARALRSFLKSADGLYAFWPPPGLLPAKRSFPTRTAA